MALVLAVFAAFAFTLLGRLYQVQVIQHEFWENEALAARTQPVILPFQRGRILDCRGVELATSETSLDLMFSFGEFRKGSPLGQLLMVHYLLTGERLTVGSIRDDPEPLLRRIGGLRTEEVRLLEPRQRRTDLLVYLSWLLRREHSEGLRARMGELAEGPLVSDWEAERVAIKARLESAAVHLAELQRDLGPQLGRDDLDLIEEIDERIAWIDEKVLSILRLRADRDALFDVERDLHREYDYRELLLCQRVPWEPVFELAADPERWPGLLVKERIRRLYPPEQEISPLLIGWVGAPAEEDLQERQRHQDRLTELRIQADLSEEALREVEQLRERINCLDYAPGEEQGRRPYGIEGYYENVLRGRRGYRKVEVDRSRLTSHRIIEQVPPEQGEDVVLTLDGEMQRVAEGLLRAQPYHGAVVLCEIPDLQIRVLASHPTPGRDEIQRRFAELAADHETYPLHPRAYAPFFPPPPGSAFKPLVAVMALSEGLVTADSTFPCTYQDLWVGRSCIRCLGMHGDVDMRRALVKSCNHYFAHLAVQVGYASLHDWAARFGFGQRTGFLSTSLPDSRHVHAPAQEVAGRLKASERGEANLMRFGFGQGAIDDVTPLQVAAAMAALATGVYLPPTLIERVGDQVPLRPPPRVVGLAPRAHQQVVDALRGVTQFGGTAQPGVAPGLDLHAYDLATKTGTPQVGGDQLDHSWFVGFFPATRPRFAFAILLEHTGVHGGDVCAPLFQALLQQPAFVEVERAARGAARRGAPAARAPTGEDP